jgi:hypothetical protein
MDDYEIVNSSIAAPIIIPKALMGFATILQCANTRLTCPLWFRLMMSDCHRVLSRVESWTDRGVNYVWSTISIGLWCAGVEHKYDARRQK